MTNKVSLTLGYVGTDFTRNVNLNDVADADLTSVKTKKFWLLMSLLRAVLARMAYPMSGQEGAYGLISCPATGDKTFSPKTTGYVNPTYPQTLYIGITETDNFKGKEVAYTITES